jgi:hypothetical protein
MSSLVVVVSSGKLNIPKTRKEKLQAELQLLEWHKMANAAAIKGALLQTKSLKTSSVASAPSTGRETPKVAPFQLEEDSKWIKRVIQQEHIKPLEVSKDFVLEYERKEKENSERLSNQVDRHISTLKQLRVKLESRHDLKSRTEEYRQWQRDFLPKKHAVMLGKTMDELETGNGNGSTSFMTTSSPTTRQGGKSTRQELDEINDELMNRTLNRSSTGGGGGGHQSSQELSNVLDSLSKLADLEKRISSLEKENKYDQMVAVESPTAGQRTKHEFEFRKKRTQIEEMNSGDNAVISSNTNKGGPMGMVYEIRPKKGGGKGGTPLLFLSLLSFPYTSFSPLFSASHLVGINEKQWKVNLPSGGGASAVRAKRTNQYDSHDYESDSYRKGGGGNTFITAGQESEENFRDKQRKDRLRQRELAPPGVKSLKSRIQIKKGRQKEQIMGAKKHEEAMREMAKRKAEQLGRGVRRNPTSHAKSSLPAKGAAAGIRTKNKHLQEFQKMKSGFDKRKGTTIVFLSFAFLSLILPSVFLSYSCLFRFLLPLSSLGMVYRSNNEETNGFYKKWFRRSFIITNRSCIFNKSCSSSSA